MVKKKVQRRKWEDITKECKFKLKADSEGTYYLDIYYRNKEIGSALSINYIIGIDALLQDDYKISNGNDGGSRTLKKISNFKILKRVN